MRRVVEAWAGVRSVVLDAVGLGLLVVAAFVWSLAVGFVVAGVAVLGLNWRLEGGGR